MVELHEVYSSFNGCKVGDCDVAPVGAVKTAVFGYLRQQIGVVGNFRWSGYLGRNFHRNLALKWLAFVSFVWAKVTGLVWLGHLSCHISTLSLTCGSFPL